MMIFPLFLLLVITCCFVIFNFFYYLNTGSIKTKEKLFKVIQIWTVLLVPIFFMFMSDIGQKNDCCTDSTLFSPNHRIGIYTLLIIYTIMYCISIFRNQILTPIIELFLNSFLIFGLVINILLCIHLNKTEMGFFFWGFGNVPIILLLIIELSKNQTLLLNHIAENEIITNNLISNFCFSILKLQPIYKFPILTILLLPIIVLLSILLILLGQKPDSIIKAFTETYKHGFSQLDYMCDNVECGGHFLCSVGANGHRNIVNPIRYGERNGKKIICNRQLLISNAFEDLIQEKFPLLHKVIRQKYNKVGSLIHKHYYIFNNKYISDIVYVLMKPLEIIFLLTLYTFDKKPENRIAIQYLSKKDRQEIKRRTTSVPM